MPTKLKILINGLPLAGASVWLGEIGGQVKVTDSEGVVSYPNITSPFQGYTEVLVENETVYASAKVLVIAGQTMTVDLGEISLTP